LHTHSEHWQHFQPVFLSLVVGQIELLSRCLPPSVFTFVFEAASDTHFFHSPARISVDVSNISPSSYMKSYQFLSQRKQIQFSLIILLLLHFRIFQHLQYTCNYTSNSNKLRNSFIGQCFVVSYSSIPSQACPE